MDWLASSLELIVSTIELDLAENRFFEHFARLRVSITAFGFVMKAFHLIGEVQRL